MAKPFAVLGAALAGRPLHGGLFGSSDLRRRLAELAAASDLVVLQLVRLGEFARAAGDRPLLVDYVDSLALNLECRAAVDRAAWRPLLRAEAVRLARCETRLLERAALGVVVGERDRAAIAAAAPAALAGRLHVVPIAVDAGSAEPMPAPAVAQLVVTGNLGYFPNADAIRWFLESVWPDLRRAQPGVELLLAGDRPSAALARRALAAGARLVVSPPALRSVLAGATLALAPLRCGSGVPIKVLEAWATETPVVASPWAAAGTTAVAGRDLAVAETPDEWRTTIARLLATPSERVRLAAAGRHRLAADYAPGVVAAAWRAAAERAARGG